MVSSRFQVPGSTHVGFSVSTRSFHSSLPVGLTGKYVGTRPVKISKATAGVQAVNIGNKKAAALDAKRKQKTGTTPYERANLAESEGGTGAAAGARRYDNNGAERPGKKSWGIRR